MIPATNQTGFCLERHDGPIGWQAITEPFATADEARTHLRDMARTPNAEYRVYPSLAVKQAVWTIGSADWWLAHIMGRQ